MRPVIAREGISIAFRGDSELLCRIGRKSWHDDQQTTRKEQYVPEMAGQLVHVQWTVREVKGSSRALIPCFGRRHKSPVLIRVLFNSTGERYSALAVDNFVDHQLS